MTKQTFVFTDPDGGKHKRTSKTRTYTHAILVKDDRGWGIGSCVGRPDLVAERLEYWGRGSDKAIAVKADD
jgi:alkanesulfonate monooxygenase SsuD/methylene tetrahydromethanopterin reductase-like flavin-dependent oxidoreductase (luciferase family)